MSSTSAAAAPAKQRGIMQKLLDGIERVGNKVPHPVMMFLYLIAFIIVLSHVLYMFGVSVTTEVLEPEVVAEMPGELTSFELLQDTSTSAVAAMMAARRGVRLLAMRRMAQSSHFVRYSRGHALP